MKRWKRRQRAAELRKYRHHLYRHFDKDGKLLYIGISLHAIVRLRGHRDHSKWFDEIAEVKIEHFDNREAALGAERLAVANEKPVYNTNLRELRRRAQLRQVPKPQVLQAETKRRRFFVTHAQVLQLVGGKPMLRRMIKNGDFPKPRYISPRKLVWYDAEIERWQSERGMAKEGQIGPLGATGPGYWAGASMGPEPIAQALSFVPRH